MFATTFLIDEGEPPEQFLAWGLCLASLVLSGQGSRGAGGQGGRDVRALSPFHQAYIKLKRV